MRSLALAVSFALAGSPAWALPDPPAEAVLSSAPAAPHAPTVTPVPAANSPQNAAPPLSISLVSPNGPLAFYEKTATGTTPLCLSPCKVTLSAGPHTLALAPPGAPAQTAGSLTLKSETVVEGEFESMHAWRWAGWGMLAITAASSIALLIPTRQACRFPDTRTGCETYRPYFNKAVMLAAFGVGASIGLIAVDDQVAVRSADR